MKILTNILTFLILAMLCFVACDDADMLHIMDDITNNDPYAGMVLIPAGEVTIGLSQKQLERYKQQYPPTISVNLEWFTTQQKALPLQTVYVDAFYMDVHEVTWRQYLDFMDASGYKSESVLTRIHEWGWKIDPELPITQLTISDMQAYATWHGKQIPTEIEWEKAARGGLEDASYPWGNTIEPTHCNYNHAGLLNALSAGGEWLLYFSKPGQYPPNGYGLYDMAGNVSEYVGTGLERKKVGVDNVISRGGNYRRPGYECQVWYRSSHSTGAGVGTVGFRCVKRITAQTPAPDPHAVPD